jgi:hypothetical protein
MRSVTALTTDGAEIGVKAEALDALAARLRGPLLTPELDGYDTARSIWNGMINHRPTVIGRCAGTADVKACVEFARDHDLLVSVKGGGHNSAVLRRPTERRPSIGSPRSRRPTTRRTSSA